MPDLVKMQRDYRSRGLQIIGITYPPQTAGEVSRFIRKLRINYPVAIATKQTKALLQMAAGAEVVLVPDDPLFDLPRAADAEPDVDPWV